MHDERKEEEPAWRIDYEAKKEVRERVRELLFEGEKIAAIKAVREATGLGLNCVAAWRRDGGRR